MVGCPPGGPPLSYQGGITPYSDPASHYNTRAQVHCVTPPPHVIAARQLCWSPWCHHAHRGRPTARWFPRLTADRCQPSFTQSQYYYQQLTSHRFGPSLHVQPYPLPAVTMDIPSLACVCLGHGLFVICGGPLFPFLRTPHY